MVIRKERQGPGLLYFSPQSMNRNLILKLHNKRINKITFKNRKNLFIYLPVSPWTLML